MKNIDHLMISPEASIEQALAVVDLPPHIALVVDDRHHLLGVITDSDIRRGLLRHMPLTASVVHIMTTNPKTDKAGKSKEDYLHHLQQTHLRHLPILDDNGRLFSLCTLQECLLEVPPRKDNLVVLMAGGLGKRLHPLTEQCPKPMLKIGGKPILEIIIERLIAQGFYRFIIAVNFMANIIEEYFGDGSERGVEISYLREDQKLGTAGALRLLKDRPNKPMLVMNSDLLTSINFSMLLNFHEEHAEAATIVVKKYELQVPYGVVNTQDHVLLSLDEKPCLGYFINAGIYALQSDIIDHIPAGQPFDMPQLFSLLLQENKKTVVFPLREYWLDIGRLEDFNKAQVDFCKHFTEDNSQ